MNNSQIAEKLDQAAFKAKAVEQISNSITITESQAYDIQKISIDKRYERGEKFIGIKLGFTSKEKMVQMGVHDMIWGRLTDAMLIKKGDTINISKYIHPRAEPELCFLVKKDIDHQLEENEIPEYIESVAAAIEIIDSRYENFKFSLEDVIADNCSSTGLVIGDWHPISTEVMNLEMQLLFNEEMVQKGNSNAILGNPIESIIAASRLCKQYQQALPAGSYIMAGAATKAEFLKAGMTVKAKVDQLGEVNFTVK